jgi:hypothetical protein
LNHVVEIDRKTFDLAKKLMACTQLESVRLSTCKVDISIDGPVPDDAKISLKLSAKSDGQKVSDTELNLHFDFRLIGTGAPSSEDKVIDVSLKLIAIYSIPRDQMIGPGEIKAFAGTNGLLNTWPYFREFIQSITARAGMPPLTVPLFRIHHKPLSSPTKPLKASVASTK